MNLLGCQHMTMVDFCDFIFACTGCAGWFERVEEEDGLPNCRFNMMVLQSGLAPFSHSIPEN